jgi:hypothetical protein
MAHHTHTRPSAILNKKMTNFSGKIKERVGEKIVIVDVIMNKQKTDGVTSKPRNILHVFYSVCKKLFCCCETGGRRKGGGIIGRSHECIMF